MSKKESEKFNEDLQINQMESNQFLFPGKLEYTSFNFKDLKLESSRLKNSIKQAYEAEIQRKNKFAQDLEKCETSEKNRGYQDIYEEEEQSYREELNDQTNLKGQSNQKKVFSPERRGQCLQLTTEESSEFARKKYLNQSIQNSPLIPNDFRYFELRLKSIEKRLATVQNAVKSTASKSLESANVFIQKKKKIRRKAIQINRKYKCCIQQCCKSYGSRSSLKGHLSIVHHIPKYKVSFKGTSIEIKNNKFEQEK